MSRLSDINGLKRVSPLGRARDGVKALRAMLHLLGGEPPIHCAAVPRLQP
jgi:hypothetical protein